MNMAKRPMYLMTEIGTIWVACSKGKKGCAGVIPIWQAADEGEEVTGTKFTCPSCRGASTKGEPPLEAPKFTNWKH